MKHARLFAGSLAIAAALFCADIARAQGTAGHGIPDPITTVELMRFADRLMLSDEQRQALQPLHDEYRERFRELREGEIDRYVEEAQQQRGRSRDEAAQRRNAILAQIRTLDESLFAGIEPMLTDAQRDRMPRVRLARQRARLTPDAQRSLAMSVRRTDLSDVILDVPLSGAERERIDGILFQYEQRLTRMYEEFPAIVSAARAQIESITAEHRDRLRGDDPAEQHRALQEMMARNHEAQLPSQEHAVAMRALGRKTLFDITPHLSDRAARQLRTLFISRTYFGSLRGAIRSHVEEALDALLDRDDLDESARRRLNELAASTTRRVEAVVREALEATDEREATETTFRDVLAMNPMAGREWERSIRERIDAIEDPVIAEVMGLLSPEAAGMFVQGLPRNRRPADAPAPPVAEATPDEVERGRRVHAQMEAHRAAMEGSHIPAAISAGDAAEYRRLLGLHEEQRAVLEEIHARYAARFKETVSPARREFVRFYGAEHGEPEDFVERNVQARRRALAAIEAVEREFFDALRAAFADRADAIDRLRLARDRARHTISPYVRMASMSGRRGMEPGPPDIDIAQLMRRQNIDAVALAPAADEILREYERELARLLRDAFAATVDASDFSTASLGLFMQREHSPENYAERRDAARTAQRGAEERLAAAERAITELNRETIDKLAAALPERESASLVTAYRERAFPQVYRDPGAMEPVLSRSLQMEDLNSSQRDRIAELLAEYRAAYADLIARMHEIAERRQMRQLEGSPRAPRPNPEAARLHEQFEKLRHERQELNARAIANLSATLDERQVARLGPMPDPTARLQMHMLFD